MQQSSVSWGTLQATTLAPHLSVNVIHVGKVALDLHVYTLQVPDCRCLHQVIAVHLRDSKLPFLPMIIEAKHR